MCLQVRTNDLTVTRSLATYIKIYVNDRVGGHIEDGLLMRLDIAVTIATLTSSRTTSLQVQILWDFIPHLGQFCVMSLPLSSKSVWEMEQW